MRSKIISQNFSQFIINTTIYIYLFTLRLSTKQCFLTQWVRAAYVSMSYSHCKYLHLSTAFLRHYEGKTLSVKIEIHFT